MLQIKILAVGRLKEDYWLSASREYIKRLGRLVRISVQEVADEPAPEGISGAVQEQIKMREGERLLRHLRPGDYAVALDLKGRRLSSEDLADWLAGHAIRGRSSLAFFIGGSLGLADQVLERCQERFKLSDLTFPHQLARIILLEQLYRACKINAGEAYHK
ncbi:MAG: 23S rRNA (pseudouridine(1915)-N(3))-methyltransferase RlmH [Desulfurispora sp.]|uniref:23S rRNA (pseudouridine(1915)-N(3))-methyltransferase RlmH n=1 Tax=Desulfurispora sp. TaxID=3014275 RepID=UPI00404A1732